jgi:hypothetical protein
LLVVAASRRLQQAFRSLLDERCQLDWVGLRDVARYWIDEAPELTGLMLADWLPDRAATVLASPEILRAALDDAGGCQEALLQRLRLCRARLMETLDATAWDESQRRGQSFTTEEAIDYALACLEAFSSLGD